MNQISPIDLSDQQLIAAVDRIACEPGRNEKERLLSDLAATRQGRQLIDWCYNPFRTYGITWKKAIETMGPDEDASFSMPRIGELLDHLASRTLTGNAAREAVETAFRILPPAACRILWLCLNKDFKSGVNLSSIKAVDPALVPIFAVMRAQTYEEKRINSFPVAVEPKLDGHRVTFIAKDGSGGFFTRTGKVIESLDHMVEPVLKALRHWTGIARITNGGSNPVNDFLSCLPSVVGTPEIVLDGEMMSDVSFAETSGALRRKGHEADVRFHVFDMLTWPEFDAMGAVQVPYISRRARVVSFILAANAVTDRLKATKMELAHSHDEIQEIYQRHRAAGYEGAMVKSLAGFYHKKKTHDWQKLKNEDTEDLPVIGVFQGQVGGKYEHTIGGLIVDRNGVEVRVSGLDDAMREEIWKLWEQTCLAVGVSPDVGYAGCSFGITGTPGPLLGRLIEVEFHEVTPDGSLRHPRFVRFRDDKTGEVEK